MDNQQPQPPAPIQQPVPPTQSPQGQPAMTGNKSFLTAVLLSYFVGSLGIDRFYLGYTGLGIAKLLTVGGCGIWQLIDLILILTNKLPDAQGMSLAGYEKDKKTAWIVIGVLYGLGFIGGLLYVIIMLPLMASGNLTQ